MSAAETDPGEQRRPVFTPGELDTWSGVATLLEWLPDLLDAQLQRDVGLTHFEYGLLYALSTAREQTLRLSVLASYANSSLTRLSRRSRGWRDGSGSAERPTPATGATPSRRSPGADRTRWSRRHRDTSRTSGDWSSTP